jgi:type I restriction enzyme, S subunit
LLTQWLGEDAVMQLRSAAVQIPLKDFKSIFKKGDLLYGKLRPYLNKVYLAEIDGICSTDIIVFPKSKTILNQYAKYRFLSDDFVRYANANSTGVQHPRVKFESLAEFPILLPPLNEQRRIVSSIEQLTDRSHKARAALEDVPKLIAQFRQSVLAAAFRGDLTADWREKNPDVKPASELLERIKIDRRDLWEKRQLEKMNIQGKFSVNDKWKEKYQEPDLPNTSTLPEIPNSWHWVKLISILLEVGDVDRKMPKAQEKGVLYISIRDFIDTEIIDF